MKNILKLSFITISFLTISCNSKVEKSEANMKEFVSTCVNEAKSSYSGQFKDEDIEKYCNCAADKAIDQLKATEMVKLNAPGQFPELQEKFMKIIQPCIDDLSKSQN